MAGKCRVHPGVFFLAALWLLTLPLGWGIGALLAASVHELFHLLAVLLCGGQVLSFSVLPWGAKMETTPLSPGREALCALAGPLGSFSVFLVAEYFPEAAVCALIQGAYNLLPIFPLDGGRILRCLFRREVCTGVEVFFLTLLSGFCLWLTVQSREVGMILFLSLWIPVIQRKFSCKESKLAVQ